jgi:peptidyl-prolyl cis-trans isomerase C
MAPTARLRGGIRIDHHSVEPREQTERAAMTDQLRASHILLMYAGSTRSSATRSKEEAQTEIDALAVELAGGADFAGLAEARSDCPSASQGGDLGTFGRGMMVGAFEDAAFALDIGETSGVIETDFGYHLIQRTG